MVLDIDTIECNPHFHNDDRRPENDLAIIILTEPVTFGSTVSAIQVQKNRTDIASEVDCKTAGWGVSGGKQSSCCITLRLIGQLFSEL